VDLDRHTIAAALAPHLHRLATPALLLDLDAVDHNIAAVLARCGDPRRWRPHLKTLKSAALLERLLAAGVTRCKVATLDELDLALETADRHAVALDVLLAYPQHPASLRAALARAEASPRCRVQCVLDSPEHLALLVHAVPFTRLAAQLDVDLGMARTGAPPAAWAAIAGELTAIPGLEITGLHGYDGHLAWDQRAEADAAYTSLCELAEQLAAAGVRRDLEIVTSGTHSYAAALAHPRLAAGPWQHQVSPGTVVLADLRSDAAMTDLGLRQAAFVAARVISRARGRLTLDAGSKALAPDRPASSNRVLGWPGLAPVSASEEHLVVHHPDELEVPGLGELVLVIPDHVCTTVNLYRRALLLRAGAVAGEAAIEAAGHRLWLAEEPT
jgi:D-serine deaminase-like pyridoxal phosphate-dependent protein